MNHQIKIDCPLHDIREIEPCDLEEIKPLLEHLQTDASIDERITFPRGTIMPDGRLDLCKQNLGAEGCRQITQALAANTKIVSLLLGTDGIGNSGAEFVARLMERNKTIEVLYLGCNLIEEQGIATLAKAFAGNHSVKGLWLKRNAIGDRGAKSLAEMLRQNVALRTLDLVNTQISGEGLDALFEALIYFNRTVERLYLGGNQIAGERGQQIAALLKSNPSIKALLLNVNQLGDQGAMAIAEALADNQSLTELGLASNGLTATGGVALLEAIASHPTLTKLDLGYSLSTKALAAEANAIGDTGAEAVGKLLLHNRVLRQLDLRRNPITAAGRQHLLAGLEKNTTLIRLLLDGKQEAPLTSLLRRNLTLNPTAGLPSISDTALIRSVYRTAKVARPSKQMGIG